MSACLVLLKKLKWERPLFGFLLNISIRGANQLIYTEKIILVLGLFSVTIAVYLNPHKIDDVSK